MATEGRRLETTFTAGEDLRTLRYHAIALDDGKMAVNGEEASGILINKPNTGEFGTLAYGGELKFAAGAAISKGGKITTTTSGWFTTAGSADVVVGECKADVTSGSFGTGLFFFPQATGAFPQSVMLPLTPKVNVLQGNALHLADLDLAATSDEVDVLAQTEATSGTATSMMLHGKGLGRMDPAHCCSYGDWLMGTTSGYLTVAASGYVARAMALQNIGSSSVGSVFFYGAGGYLAA